MTFDQVAVIYNDSEVQSFSDADVSFFYTKEEIMIRQKDKRLCVIERSTIKRIDCIRHEKKGEEDV